MLSDRCPHCQCSTFSKVNEPTLEGGWDNTKTIRCVECKRTYAARNEALLEVEEGLGSSRSPAQPGSAKPRRQTLEDLLAMVEAAEGPSRELDGAIFVALECVPNDGREGVHGWTFKPAFSPYLHQERGDWHPAIEGDAPAYTVSVDAALALVERVLPSAWFEVGNLGVRRGLDPDGMIRAKIGRMDVPEWPTTFAATPALALLAALLKALLSSEAQPPGSAREATEDGQRKTNPESGITSNLKPQGQEP